MSNKVVVDKNYQPVAADSPEAAYVFNDDDPRLEKYADKQAESNAKSKDKAKAAPTPAQDEDDGSVERVQRPAAKK